MLNFYLGSHYVGYLNMFIEMILKTLLLCLHQGLRATHREARPLTGRLGLLHGGRAFHREARPPIARPSLSQVGRASDKKAGLSQEAGPLTDRPSLSQGGKASDKKAEPLTGRPGL